MKNGLNQSSTRTLRHPQNLRARTKVYRDGGSQGRFEVDLEKSELEKFKVRMEGSLHEK